ncbi:telomere-associated protein RIF1 isoform X3 [Ascaphus truei]|uniref:telomere-associated protein RIF1 isoform X3 n=1 Tax=Ascaphus truei TaxID=8439 RepID=UPI003F592504
METRFSGKMSIYSEDSHLLPLLETLEDPSTSHAEQTDAYLSIANRLSGEEGKDFTVLVGGQFPRLGKVFKAHISNEDSDLSNAALQALGFCLFNNNIVSGLSGTEIEEFLSALNRIAVNATDKNTCTRALWVISKQSFPPEEVGKAVPSILSTLESIFKDVQSHVLEHEALNVVIRLLEQTPAQMADEAVRWAKLIIPLVVHSSPKVRLRSAAALEMGMPWLLQKQPEVSAFTEQLMTSKMIAELQKLFSSKNETYVLKLWPLFVKILGKTLHRSGSFINSLLQLEELGFRSGSPAVKKIAFIAWKSLIDNFSLNPDIMCSTKRLKLLMQPLSSIHVRTEALALTKIEVWWYLLVRLGSQLPVHFEQVCLPLIQRALNVESTPSTPARTPNQSLNASTPMQRTGSFPFGSPTTPKINLSSSLLASAVYPSIHLLGIEMMLHFFLGPEVTTFANQNKLVLSLEPLQHPLVSSSSFFCKHAGTLLHAMQDGFISVGKDASDVIVNAVWRDMIAFVKAAIDTGNKKERQGSEVLTLLLQTLKNIISSDALPVQKSMSLLECTIKGLPQKVLGSAAYQGTPALFLMQLLFHTGLLESGVMEERFFINFETLVSYVLSGSTSPLAFSESVIGELNLCAKLLQNKEHLWRLWSILINPLTDRVNQTNEVNQGDALEHNFSALHSALMLPVTHIFPITDFPQPTIKTLLRTWSELYKAFARCAALVTTTDENVCCEELCSKILSDLGDLPLGLCLLDRIVQVVAIIVEGVNFSPYNTKFQPKTKAPQTPTDWSKKKKEPLGNLNSLLKLLVKLVECFHVLGSEEPPSETTTPTMISIGGSIVGLLTTCVSHISLPSVVRTVIMMLTKPIAVFYEKTTSESPKVYSGLTSKLEKLLGDLLLCLGSYYNGTYDSELLEALSPLLCAIFLHKNKQIRNQTAQFWNASFAKATVLIYPEGLKPVLNKVKLKTPLLLPGFTFSNAGEEECSGPYSDNMDNFQLDTKISGIEVKSTGKRDSLLAKTEDLKDKGSATRVSQAKLKLNFSSPKTKEKLLEEEQSVDFVFIPPENKERVLTEHQKEVLRTKRVDIPTMYNNLDASQDTTLFTQYSQSQDSSLEKPTVKEGTKEIETILKEKPFEGLSDVKDPSKAIEKDVEMLDSTEQPSKMANDSTVPEIVQEIEEPVENTSNVSNTSASSDVVSGTPPQPVSRRQSFITLEKFENSLTRSFSPLSNTQFPKAEIILVPDSQEALEKEDSHTNNKENSMADMKPSKNKLQKSASERKSRSDSACTVEHTESKQNLPEEPMQQESSDESMVKANESNGECFGDKDCIPDSQMQELEPKVVEFAETDKVRNPVQEEDNLESKENTPPEALAVNHIKNDGSLTPQAASNQMSLRRSSRRQSEILEGVRSGKNENANQKRDKAREEEKSGQKKVAQAKENLHRQKREKLENAHESEQDLVKKTLTQDGDAKTSNIKPDEEDLPDSNSSKGSQEAPKGRPRYQTRRSSQALLPGTENSESDNSETREETSKRKLTPKGKTKSTGKDDKSESSPQSSTENDPKTETLLPVKNKLEFGSEVDVELVVSQICKTDNKTYTIITDNTTILDSKILNADTNASNVLDDSLSESEPTLCTRQAYKTYDLTNGSTKVYSIAQSLMTEPTVGDFSTAVSDVFKNSDSNLQTTDCLHKRSKRVRRSKSCDCCCEPSNKQEKSFTELKTSELAGSKREKIHASTVGSDISSIDTQFDETVFTGPCAVSTPLLATKEPCFFKPSVSELKSDLESEQENTVVSLKESISDTEEVTQVCVQTTTLEVPEPMEEDKMALPLIAGSSETAAESTALGTECVHLESHEHNDGSPIELVKEDAVCDRTFDVEVGVESTSNSSVEKLVEVANAQSNLAETVEKSLVLDEVRSYSVTAEEIAVSLDAQKEEVEENLSPAAESCAVSSIPEIAGLEDLAEGRIDTDSPPKLKGLAALVIANDSPGEGSGWSPSASPSTSILKKGVKRQQENDSPSPINKIRRVSFANPIYQEELADDIDRRSPVIRGHSSNSSPSRSLKTSTNTHPKLNTTPTKGFVSPGSRILGFKSSKKCLITEMTKESMPSPKESVYPALMNCTTSVDVILPQITSNMWARGLGQLIRAKNIKSVGDLSTLSPSEIKTLPIRSPKVSTVKKALRVYHEQQMKAKGFDEFAALAETEKSLNGLDEKHSPIDEEKLETDLMEQSTSAMDTPPSPDTPPTTDLLTQITALSSQLSSEDLSTFSGSHLFEIHEKLSGMSNCVIRHLQSRWRSPPHESSV